LRTSTTEHVPSMQVASELQQSLLLAHGPPSAEQVQLGLSQLFRLHMPLQPPPIPLQPEDPS